MSTSKLTGKVQTVLGPISVENLGIVLIHEHLLADFSKLFPMREPTFASEKALAHQSVCLENRYWITYNSVSNLDNVQLLD